MREISTIELRRQSEQVRLDALKTPRQRNELGQFATPPALALEITQYVRTLWRKREDKVRFLDPGIGTGAFYAALRKGFPNGQLATAVGIELDPVVANAAASLWKGTGLKVISGDFTTQPPPRPDRRHNLILTNPPYVRHHHLGRKAKERLQAAVAKNLSIKISGLAGLYCYFLLLCHEWLATDGLAVWLIPSEFMDVNYGAAVKEYLTRHVTLLHIHRFSPSDVQFADALVTSAIVVFQKSPPATSTTIKFSCGGSLLMPEAREKVPLMALRANDRKWTHFPAITGSGNSTGRLGLTLGDLFTIKRGIATGANEYFILPKHEAQRRGIPHEFSRPILPSPRFLTTTIIDRDRQGYPRVEQPLTLIDCDRPEQEIRKRYPAFWSYLEEGKQRKIHERYLPAGRRPWYSQEQRPAAPFLCTYMGRKRTSPFRFIWNRSDATAANVYLLLYPREPLQGALDADPELYGAVFKLLQSIRAEHFLSEGRVYGGGLFKMEPRELARLSAEPFLKALGQTQIHEGNT